MKWRKVPAILLLLAVCFAALSTLAVEEGVEEPPITGTEVTTFAGLKTAVEAGGVVNVSGTIEITGELTVTRPVTITGGGTLKRVEAYTEFMFVVENGGALTLENLTLDGAAPFLGKNINDVAAGSLIYIKSGGAATLNDGAVLKDHYSTDYARASMVFVDKDGSFVMNAGSILKNSNVTNCSGGGVYNNGSFTLNGGTIEKTKSGSEGGGVINYSGDFVMNDGLLTGCEGQYGGGVRNRKTFTMNGGTITKAISKYAGGGVSCIGSTTFIMRDGEISFCKVTSSNDWGGGIYSSSGGALEIYGGTIKCNTAGHWGGGICYCGNTKFILKNATVQGNKLTNSRGCGGGVYLSSKIAVTMENCSVTGNSCEYNGGGVYVVANTPFVMKNSTISSNKAKEGAGVFLGQQSEFTMESGSITNNAMGTSADYYGGGVCLYNTQSNERKTTFTLNGGTISGNKSGHGGGVYGSSNTLIIMNGGTISNNPAGGGVQSNGDFKLRNGAIQNNVSSYFGAGICMSGGKATFEMTDGTVTGNKSNTGGGGIALLINTPGTITDGEISGNTAIQGGGIFIAGGTVTLNGTRISGNRCIGNSRSYPNWLPVGGGLYVEGNADVTLTDVIISDNVVEKRAADSDQSCGGGGISLRGAGVRLTATDCVISGNRTESSGGGIGVIENSACTLINTTVRNNTALGEGGGIFVGQIPGYSSDKKKANLTMNGVTVQENQAQNGGGACVRQGEGATTQLTVNGGTITENTASAAAGGVLVDGPLTLSGAVKVTENAAVTGEGETQARRENNLYLPENKTVSVGTDGLADGAVLGVTTAIAPAVGAPVPVTEENTADWKAFFSSDLEAYTPAIEDGNAVQLVFQIPATGITLSPAEATLAEAGTATLTVTPEPGDTTDALTVTSGDEAIATVAKNADGTWTLTGVAAGTATITATVGAYTAACTVTVEHVWAGAWTSDETNHWHACTQCPEKKDEAGHTWSQWTTTDTDHTRTCTVCGKEVTGPHNVKTEAWLSDRTNHWHACDPCGWKQDEAAHTYGEDGLCTVCGARKPAPAPPPPEPPAEDALIFAEADRGGSVYPMGQITLPKGASQSFTVTPEDGYEILDVLVDGVSVGPVTHFTFETVVGEHTILVCFRKAASRPAWNPFVDVTQGDWFHDSVKEVYEAGLMKGTGETQFSPGWNTTRGMIVTILYRMEGEPPVSGGTTFEDVKSGAYYADAVKWGADHGIVLGYNSRAFGPGDDITREQMAAMIYRYACYKGMDTGERADLSAFSDAERISPYARTAISWANARGLVIGTSPTTLAPRNGATRAQAAAILARFRKDAGLTGAGSARIHQ